MLDIQKELEKFNRLLEEVDEEVGRSNRDSEPAADEIPDASPVIEATDADEVLDSETYEEIDDPLYVSAEATTDEVGEWPIQAADATAVDIPAVDTPVVDTPVVDTPVVDTPVVDTPVVDTPAVDTPVVDTPVVDASDVDVPISHIASAALLEADEVADEADEYRTKYHADSYDEAILIAAEAADRPWRLTEHVGPDHDPETADPAENVPVVNDPVEEDPVELGLHLSDIGIDERSRPFVAPDIHGDVPIDSLRIPNKGHQASDRFPLSDEPVNSLLRGVRSALTDSHRPRSKFGVPVSLKLPKARDGEEDSSGWGGYARILPLMTFRSGVYKEHLGMVLGAVAAVVVLLAGGLFVVPKLFSSDDVEAMAESAATAETDHIHASADALPSGEPATLSISTYPPGARVYLNAELIGVTPFQGINVETGNYQMSVEKTSYERIDTLFIIDRPRQFFFDLNADVEAIEQDHLTLSVEEPLTSSSLSGSARVPAPSETSTSSSRAENLAGGTASANENTLTERRSSSEENASSSARRESSSRSRRSARQPEPPAMGALIVTSEPMGATVFVDGDLVGETPLSLSNVQAGRVSLSMQKEGFVPYETDLNVVRSIQTPFHAALAPVKAALFVNASPGGDLYIDGQLVRSGITPGHMEMVSVGTRELRVVNKQYGEWTTAVNVTPDGKSSVSVDMVVHGYESGIENGDRFFNESRYAEAIEEYNRALSIRPGNRTIENKIGLAAKAMAESSMPSADTRTAPADGIYAVTDTPAQLIGGLEALHGKVIYPEVAYKAGTQGRVYVQFVVDENGRAQDLKIARGLPNGCNDAAISAVKRSRFKPATVAGLPVKSRHTLFVNFTID